MGPLAAIYKRIMRGRGLPTDDLNDGDQIGFDVPQVTLDESGTRTDTYRTYIQQAEKRRNLYVLKHAHVNKVLIDEANFAYGVQVIRYGSLKSYHCKREVILSAGAVGSPTILMRSGIGPSDHLTKLKIPVKRDLPVGDNLHDHVTTMLGPFLVDNIKLFDIVRSATPSVVWQYLKKGSGPLAATVACDSMGFLRGANATTEVPNIQYHISGVPLHGDYGTFFGKTFGFPSSFWEAYAAPNYGRDAATILPVVLHPKSRGTLRLKSKDPFEKPLLDPQYLTHPHDIATAVEAIEIIYNVLTNSSELRPYGYSLPETPVPGCEDAKPMFTAVYWECYVRHLTMTMYHPVGTCAMGSVTDSKMMVKGVHNLRVVDGSIMPTIVSGNTNAPIVAMSELASDLIKERWRTQFGSGDGGTLCSASQCIKEEL